jgi:hypothetical protein
MASKLAVFFGFADKHPHQTSTKLPFIRYPLFETGNLENIKT